MGKEMFKENQAAIDFTEWRWGIGVLDIDLKSMLNFNRWVKDAKLMGKIGEQRKHRCVSLHNRNIWRCESMH